MVRYLSTVHVTKANFVIFGGLKRYKGGVKSNLQKIGALKGAKILGLYNLGLC